MATGAVKRSIDPVTGERRDKEFIRNLLQMIRSPPVRDSCHQATLIRNCLSDKFWRERERRAWGLLNSPLFVKFTLELL